MDGTLHNVTARAAARSIDTRAETAQRRLLWAYPPLLAAAEGLVGFGQPLFGMALHALLLLALANQSAFGAPGVRRITLGLLLVPLLRLLGLALPVGELPSLLLYAAAGAAMLGATWLVVRTLRLPRAAVGLTLEGLWMQLLLMGCGVGLGYAGYELLDPQRLAPDGSWQLLTASALALLIFGGFAEELLFRGLLQTVAGPALGRWGPLYVAVLYGGIQAGFGSPLYALLAFIVGLLFAGVVRLSGSIVGVALAHGLSSVVLLLVMPFVAEHPGSPLAQALQPAMLIGGGCAALAVAMLLLRRLTAAPPSPSGVRAGALLARLRRETQLTYIDLGLRAGLPARLIAEIELGLQPLAPEHATRLARALGVGSQELLATAP